MGMEGRHTLAPDAKDQGVSSPPPPILESRFLCNLVPGWPLGNEHHYSATSLHTAHTHGATGDGAAAPQVLANKRCQAGYELSQGTTESVCPRPLPLGTRFPTPFRSCLASGLGCGGGESQASLYQGQDGWLELPGASPLSKWELTLCPSGSPALCRTWPDWVCPDFTQQLFLPPHLLLTEGERAGNRCPGPAL